MKKKRRVAGGKSPKPGARKDSLGRVIRPAQTAGVKKPIVGGGDNGVDLVCPDYLGEIGRECWEGLKARLESRKILDSHDAEALELFAAAYETFRDARTAVAKNGLVIEGVSDRGNPTSRKNPAADVMATAWNQCRALMPELGIGPSSRAKLSTAEEESDPLEDFLNAFKAKN